MNTYKWVVSSLDAKIEDGELSNVIETVHYRYQAEDADGNVADVYGSIGLESPDASKKTPTTSLIRQPLRRARQN
jgi:hypothetical protein